MKYALLLCISFGTMSAITNQELFLRANKEFHEGDYVSAIAHYQAVTHKASAVLYNMGICFYKSGECAQALACFKRARRIANRSMVNAIMENTERVERIMQVYQEPSTGQIVMRYIRGCVAGTSLLQWQIIMLLVLYISALCIWRCKRRVFSILLGFFTLLCVMGFMPILVIKGADEYVHTGIVLPKSLVVYSGPYHHCHQQGTLESGREVTVLQGQKGWYKIQYDTIVGWVDQESLALTI